MTFSSDREIERIYSGILDQTLPKSEWTHEAHFAAAVAIICDKNHEAFRIMPEVIKAYNIATGVQNTDTDGYHHTITLASLMATDAIVSASPTGRPSFEITNEILALEFGSTRWLLAYWSEKVLFSVKARIRWVGPDIRAMPFSKSL